MTPLHGHCPHGCGETLFVYDGRIICAGEACDDDEAVNKILQDGETEHIVRFSRHSFTVRHPLRERIGDELMNCEVHLECGALMGPPEGEPGLYRVYPDHDRRGEYRFERISA